MRKYHSFYCKEGREVFSKNDYLGEDGKCLCPLEVRIYRFPSPTPSGGWYTKYKCRACQKMDYEHASEIQEHWKNQVYKIDPEII